MQGTWILTEDLQKAIPTQEAFSLLILDNNFIQNSSYGVQGACQNMQRLTNRTPSFADNKCRILTGQPKTKAIAQITEQDDTKDNIMEKRMKG